MNQKELTLLFERLGANEPEDCARSQTEEGINQLGRYLFLRQAWRLVVNEDRLMCTSKRDHMLIMTFLILTLNSRLLVEANDSQQPQVSPATPGHGTGAPRFDEFPVHTKRQGQQHWLSLGRCDQVFGKGEDFGHRLVRERAKAGGATFAGHYSILVCSCGTECGVVSIVDLSFGRIYDFEHMSQVCADARSNYRDFLYFRADSSLLILIGSPPKLKNGAGRNKGCAVRYYRWTGRRLILLKEAPVSKNAAEQSVRPPVDEITLTGAFHKGRAHAVENQRSHGGQSGFRSCFNL